MTEPLPAPILDRASIRTQFPSLEGPVMFLDNAGGSQVPRSVADRVRDYFLTSYVQLGADYETSRRAGEVVDRARAFLRLLVHGEGIGEVTIGPSTSQLCAMLAGCYARALDTNRDEVIVCDAGHEANIGPWKRLEGRGYTVRTWKLDSESQTCRLEDLESLLSSRTRLVAVPHVSNLLGRIEDLEGITHLAHGFGARVVVDGVALAPHRAIDVSRWRADWYLLSAYKVYGPHVAALFGTHEAYAELEGPNHFFIPSYQVPGKFELGGVCHEACAGLLGTRDYLAFLAGRDSEEELQRNDIESAYALMEACEAPLQEALIQYLLGKPPVRLIGPPETDSKSRVSTISFVHESKSSADIARAANRQKLGIRFGHFYAWSLCEALGLDPEDGVVRTSLVHYNDLAEVERLIDCFEHIL